MRRAVAGVIGSGLVLGGAAAAWGSGIPALAGERPGLAGAATKIVVYRHYEITVPVSWPVYRLDADPTRCVRFDVSAVYLGRPGPDQRCPAGLIGRAETVSILPPGAAAAATGPGAAATATGTGAVPAGGGTMVRALPAVRGAIIQDAGQHEFRVAVPGPAAGMTVMATYGADSALAERVLATLRVEPAAVLPGRRLRPPFGPAVASRRRAAAVRRRGVPPSWPAWVTEPEPDPVNPGGKAPLRGFDACTAPPLSAMRAWRARYAAVGIYIGGVNAACDYGNLSAAWIRSAGAMGWAMVPAYVGPQASCFGYRSTKIDDRKAAAEGRAAAADAARDAASLGLGGGSPVYYDMEAYSSGDDRCAAGVLTFLSAWTRELNARGYVSGVYASQAPGIADMQAAVTRGPAGFAAPQAIWVALWDGRRTLDDGVLAWPLTARSKQYLGPRCVKVGGITLDIDTDLFGGPVAG